MELTHALPVPQSLLKRLNWLDWMYAALVIAGAGYALARYGAHMEGYEQAVLIGAAGALTALGWHWKAIRVLLAVITMGALTAITLYQGDLARADHVFGLKYFLSSQTAIMWMSVLFALATIAYWGALVGRSHTAGAFASGLTWSAVAMALVGLLARWYESYLISPDVGHIPISNLYEVFVLFCIITSLLYLYYEGRYTTRQIGAFVSLVIMGAVGFLLWYTFDRCAHEIQPLVPALPTAEVMDDLMYKLIAIGFAFFTIATILGAMWAAEAWGGYWSWDPKETWALIVWLNYAAWLHMRLIKGLRGPVLAWWAVVGLFVTLFAFLGVNMFLSGLHSYGQL